MLLAAIVGSGIMGEKLAGGNVAIALLANTMATGAMLVTLIFTFGPISGAHFNPAVTLAIASQRGIGWGDVPFYILAQVLGALLGVGAAHFMFAEAVLQVSEHAREGSAQLFSEFVATIFGQEFRIGDSANIEIFRQDDGRRKNRPSKTTTTDFIDTDDRTRLKRTPLEFRPSACVLFALDLNADFRRSRLLAHELSVVGRRASFK